MRTKQPEKHLLDAAPGEPAPLLKCASSTGICSALGVRFAPASLDQAVTDYRMAPREMGEATPDPDNARRQAGGGICRGTDPPSLPLAGQLLTGTYHALPPFIGISSARTYLGGF